jgi:ribosomal protein S18 acetylase RimI-like enzyme
LNDRVLENYTLHILNIQTMAIPKKSTRQITVDGVVYRWIVSPDDEPGLGIVVECAEFPGEKMITWVEHGNIISPWLVRKAILHALSRGWQPQKLGQSIGFRLKGMLEKENNDLESALHIRQYQEKDHQSILNLHTLALNEAGVNRGKGKWDDDLHDISGFYINSAGEFFVGCIDGNIITMGAFKPFAEQKVEIRRMRVHPDFQRRGYGQQILVHLEKQIVRAGFKVLTLHTTSIQVAAQKLYIKNGYIEVERRPWTSIERIYFEKRFL